MDRSDLPVLKPLPDGGISIHATTVACGGSAVAILGKAGSGKSGTAAQMIAMGGHLVVDDLTVLRRQSDRIVADAPPDHIPALELWGLGIVPMRLSGPTWLAALLILAPSTGRLPIEETMDILGLQTPVLRHPARPDLAAKLLIWLRSREHTDL